MVADAHSVERRLLHIKIFYGPLCSRVKQTLPKGKQCVMHPLLEGRIPKGYGIRNGVREKYYQDETSYTARSERETEKTASSIRGRALSNG